jgi:hypothetical protein
VQAYAQLTIPVCCLERADCVVEALQGRGLVAENLFDCLEGSLGAVLWLISGLKIAIMGIYCWVSLMLRSFDARHISRKPPLSKWTSSRACKSGSEDAQGGLHDWSCLVCVEKSDNDFSVQCVSGLLEMSQEEKQRKLSFFNFNELYRAAPPLQRIMHDFDFLDAKEI